MALTSAGPAVVGWPATGAVVDDDRLHVVSRNLDRTVVAELDLATGRRVDEVRLPAGDGAWAAALAPDGIYLGLFGARGRGNLLRLRGGRVGAVAALDVDYVWDLAVAPDGSVIAVCSHPALVARYDPATGRATDLGVLAGGQVPRTCQVVGGRLVVGGADAGRAVLVDRGLEGGPVRSILPPSLGKDVRVYCSAPGPGGRLAIGTAGPGLDAPAVAVLDPADPGGARVVRLAREALVDTVAWVGGEVWATARPSGAVYRLDPASGALRRTAVPVPLSETRLLHALPGGAVGVSADGTTWRHDRGGAVRTTDPDAAGLEPRPQRAQAILAAADRVDVGGSFCATRHRPGDPRATASRFVPGEPKAMVDVAGTTYMAIYPIAEVWAWPPDRDPHRVTQLDADQLRPVAMDHVDQLGALVVTTTDDHRRSVLNTVDPVTGRIDRVVNPLGDQALGGVVAVGPTVVVGGSGAKPGVAAFDVVSGRRLWTAVGAVPDGGFVLGLQVVGDRVVVTTSRGWAAALRLSDGRVIQRARRVAPVAGQLRRAGADLLLTTGDALLRLDPATLAATPLEWGLDGQHWNWPPMDVDPAGRAWLLRGRELVRHGPAT